MTSAVSKSNPDAHTLTSLPLKKKSSLKDKKIAIFLPALYGGGAERTMLSLARGIAARGYTVDLVLAQAEGEYMSSVPDSVRVVDLGSGVVRNSQKTLSRLPALMRYLKIEKPDAIISALVQAGLITTWARKLARYKGRVIVNQQNTLSSWSTDSDSLFKKLSPRLVRYCFPWADSIIGVSQGVADDLINNIGIPAERVGVIHNPAVTSTIQLQASAPLDHDWFQTGQPPVILAVGSLTAQKDFHTLLRAFDLVRKRCNARLIVLGEGSERQSLENLIRQLQLESHVSLPGFVENPYAYISRAAVFVLSSKWEGLPTVLIEAMYCGIPLVATDCPSGPREILKAGKIGHLIAVSDPVAMSDAICLALEEKTSPNDHWKPYELETIVDQYIKLIFQHD